MLTNDESDTEFTPLSIIEELKTAFVAIKSERTGDDSTDSLELHSSDEVRNFYIAVFQKQTLPES